MWLCMCHIITLIKFFSYIFFPYLKFKQEHIKSRFCISNRYYFASVNYFYVKVRILIERYLHSKSPWPAALYNLGSGSWLARANGAAAQMRPSIARVNGQLDPRHAVSKHTAAPINHTRLSPRKHSPDGATRARNQTLDCSLLPIYRPRKDERLSWLTFSRWYTHISGHLSAAGWAQDRASSPAKERRSTAVPRHHSVT